MESERSRATGTIVDYAAKKHPVVEFTANGRLYRLEYPVATEPDELPVGTQVEVLHHPDDPARFHLEQDEGEAPDQADDGTADQADDTAPGEEGETGDGE